MDGPALYNGAFHAKNKAKEIGITRLILVFAL